MLQNRNFVAYLDEVERFLPLSRALCLFKSGQDPIFSPTNDPGTIHLGPRPRSGRSHSRSLSRVKQLKSWFFSACYRLHDLATRWQIKQFGRLAHAFIHIEDDWLLFNQVDWHLSDVGSNRRRIFQIFLFYSLKSLTHCRYLSVNKHEEMKQTYECVVCVVK